MPDRVVWLTCSGCGSMWKGLDGETCWACISIGRPSRSPALNSQHGFAPIGFDDD